MPQVKLSSLVSELLSVTLRPTSPSARSKLVVEVALVEPERRLAQVKPPVEAGREGAGGAKCTVQPVVVRRVDGHRGQASEHGKGDSGFHDGHS